MDKRITVATVVLTGVFAGIPVAHARDGRRQGPYVGVSAGLMHYKASNEPTGFTFSDTAPAYGLFGGYQLNRYFALEGAWLKSNRLKDTASGVDSTLGAYTLDTKASDRIIYGDVLGFLPLTRISLFAGVGYYQSHTKLSGNLTTPAIGSAGFHLTDTANDNGAMIKAGVEYDLARLGVRAQYTWFNTPNDVTKEVASVKAFFRF